MTHKNQGYFSSIAEGFSTLWQSLVVTMRHLYQARKSRKPIGVEDSNYFDQKTGIVTLQYPFESFPIPDNGRYRLHNEIEDCIVCDLCAKICPVDCIDITAVKSTEEIGKTSDGTTKRLYAAQFDIDMAKCCYCGLCTTVCPTECLTMTKTYDYSEFDVTKMVYHFTDLSPEEAEKKKAIYEEAQRLKTAAKASVDKNKTVEADPKKTDENKSIEKKPFKPFIKAPVENGGIKGIKEGQKELPTSDGNPQPVKPMIVFKPKIASPGKADPDKKGDQTDQEKEVGKSGIEPPAEGALKNDLEGKDKSAPSNSIGNSSSKPKIVFKPKITIPSKTKESGGEKVEEGDVPEGSLTKANDQLLTNKRDGEHYPNKVFPEPTAEDKPQKPKIIFKPKIPGITKPTSDLIGDNTIKKTDGSANSSIENRKEDQGNGDKNLAPKAAPKPVIKPKIPGLKKPDPNTDDAKN